MILMWLLVGFIPYHVNKQGKNNGWIFQSRALFWTLEINDLPGQRKRWTLRIPLIEKLRSAVWLVLMHLQDNLPPK